MAFLRNLLATLVGLFLFTFIGFMILVGIVSVASSGEVPTVKKNSVLYFNLSGILVEKTVEDPIQELLSNAPVPVSSMDIIEAIREAKEDDRIKGIYLESGFFVAGQSSLKEIREVLLDFKESGKFIYGYGEYISEANYYLISAADKIYLNPEGSLEFNGLTANVTFFKGLLDKLEIEPEIFRVGTYKSAVEPFLRKDMSEENKEQLTELIESIHATYLSDVSDNLNTSVEDLKNISDQMEIRFPEDAEKKGLVTKVGYEDEIKGLIKEELGLEADGTINFISVNNYSKATDTESTQYSENRIAVIVANGEIIMGKSEDAVGGEQFASEIRKARESKSVKAIVLRVNSPGGSMTASDMIWREIELTKGVKPIIASMSDVAASGGYYISAPCDTIVAQPNTITGSIGIFGILFNFGDFLENKLGITNDGVKTGDYSDIFNVTRSLNVQERQIIQTMVNDGYETFISKVAAGRSMSKEDVLEVAGGRVWTGEQAYEKKLVDVLGSFDDAVKIAAEKAGVEEDYRLSFYPRPQPFIEQILGKLSDEADARLFHRNSIINTYVRQIESVQRMNGIQALLPGNLSIQ